jgi:hypothetical protein
MSGYRLSSMCLILLMIIMALAIVVFPLKIHSAYSQKSDHDGVISILGSSSYTDVNEDDELNYHVVGEVKNNSPIDSMNNVKIIATFYDKSEKVIGTDFTYTNLDVLRPSEMSSFEIILNDAEISQKIDSYKLSVSGEKTESLPAALKLSVSDSHLDDMGAFHIVGKVTNQGSEKATFVKVSGALYNSSNAIVAAVFVYTDPQELEPGQTAPFNIIVDSPIANEITSTSLNVGSKQYSSVLQNER